MRAVIVILILLSISTLSFGQEKYVTLTMDDLFMAFNDLNIRDIGKASDSLLNIITQYKVQVTVFVNERSFIKEGEAEQRLSLVKKWVENPFITIGNHTYSHHNYADSDLSFYMDEIMKGETITRELLKEVNKELKFFRFPFNSTCRDSISRVAIYNFLTPKGYTVTPFTIESSDYMYNALYCNFLKEGNMKAADKIKEQYVDFTVQLFRHFEAFSNKLYGRNINHIFLCHTNLLNASALPSLVIKLKQEGYSFISLDSALEDKVYQNTDYYYGRYGFSWIYRWIENKDVRKTFIKEEPCSKEIEEQYNKLIGQK